MPNKSDIDLLIEVLEGRKMTDQAREAGCTPPNIRRKVIRAKDRIGWTPGMSADWVRERAAALYPAKDPEARRPFAVSVEDALAGLLGLMQKHGLGDLPEVETARQALADARGEIHISTLNMTTRSERLLLDAGIASVRQLCQLTEVDLLRLPMCGKRNLIEIKDVLASRGKELGTSYA